MDLYDDLDTKQRAGQIDGWSSGIKLLQSQLALKKTAVPPQTRKDHVKRSTILAPVMLLKSKKENDIDDIFRISTTTTTTHSLTPSSKVFNEYDWDVIDEYDPLWPNEYEKLVKDKRDKEMDKPRERNNSNREEKNLDRKRRNTRFNENDSPPPTPANKFSGFGGRPDDEDTYSRSPPSNQQSRGAGAAIAPPLSLQESTPIIPPFAASAGQAENKQNSANVTVPYGTSSVAAKIMAKYGFKDGQGLGKQEQGMSIALQVEKTSKRGGRIIHEKELLMPPPAIPSPPMAPPPAVKAEEPTITEIMKTPSKVVLLRNMVGPGDVDNDLEPEVKDECNTKYGDVVSVVINELQNVVPEEAVRIFVEFKRIESAIKAVVDLNGRFFGGRQVKAGFFGFDKYKAYQLYD